MCNNQPSFSFLFCEAMAQYVYFMDNRFWMCAINCHLGGKLSYFFTHVSIVPDDLQSPGQLPWAGNTSAPPGAALPGPTAHPWRWHRGLQRPLSKEPKLLQHLLQRRHSSLFQSKCLPLHFDAFRIHLKANYCTEVSKEKGGLGEQVEIPL